MSRRCGRRQRLRPGRVVTHDRRLARRHRAAARDAAAECHCRRSSRHEDRRPRSSVDKLGEKTRRRSPARAAHGRDRPRPPPDQRRDAAVARPRWPPPWRPTQRARQPARGAEPGDRRRCRPHYPRPRASPTHRWAPPARRRCSSRNCRAAAPVAPAPVVAAPAGRDSGAAARLRSRHVYAHAAATRNTTSACSPSTTAR